MSQNLFFLMYTHLSASWPWTMKGMLMRSRQWSTVSVLCLLVVPVDGVKVVCVCQSICQSREMLIRCVVPFQKQYEVREAIADVPLYING